MLMPKAKTKTTEASTDTIAALEHERLTALINSMADGVIAVDENLTVVLYNGAALNILDVNRELRGQNIQDAIILIDKNNQKVAVEKLIEQSATQYTTRDLRLQYPNDELVNLYLSVASVHLGYGIKGQRGHVLLLRDITREKSLEEERDEFISVVSHELRTPIAIAEGNISNAQLVVDKSNDIPDAVKQSLKAAYNQVIFLSGMINDLATLSRAERGKLNVEIEPINAHELVEELVSNYTPEAEKKNLKLSGESDPELHLLQSGKLYVREILQNFITNAIKYTEAGTVRVSAHSKGKGVEFQITDTGIGLSKPDKERIFDKFFRSEDFRTKQSSGTGLGLYVTMKLAHLLHAEIEVDSVLNKGSTFKIFFPDLK